jgi:Uma2 family endonuclease
MAVELTHVRFSVGEYHRIAEAGILGEDDRVELIDGELVRMSPVGRVHAATVRRLNRLLAAQAGDLLLVDIQNPLQLSDDTEPEPDVAVLRYRADFYEAATPAVADTYFLIEVADSSLAYDRQVKIPRYARAGIPEVWLVDLDNRRFERHSNPALEGYRDVVAIGPGQALASTVVSGLVLAADQILASG